MCGIVGIVQGATIDEGLLWRLAATLHHRGPDDGDVCVLDTGDRRLRAGLGHRRLSIIDLSPAGRQPMSNEDGAVWITYNGEIYNFQELRRDLERRGHAFRSRTDTEVILHGYEEFGIDVLNKLNGMFAVGLWDGRKNRLILARDRFGKKPLYYWDTGDGLVFASEIKAILKHPAFTRAIDPAALSRFLAYEYVPAPYSIFTGIRKLPAGCFLEYRDGKATVERYWRISFGGASPRPAMSREDAEAELLKQLDAAVERRLVSDVPLGVFLSGGIDSSAVVAMMARHVAPNRIKTFSIGFDEPTFDESPYARMVARHFGTDHHERRFSVREMLEVLPRIVEIADEPFADASILPTYLLSRHTRESVTVALGGDGGDELFAGYDPFVAHRLFAVYERIPRALRGAVIEPLIRRLPVSAGNMSLDFRAKQMIRGADYPRMARNQAWLGAFTPQDQQDLLTPDAQIDLRNDDPLGDIPATLSGIPCRDWIDETVAFYVSFYLAEDILTKVDRASMAVSLEVRAPFLDAIFAEFVNGLPSNLKLRGLTRKYLLKKALSTELPREILRRKKKGFGIPLTKWLREDLRPALQEALSPARIRRDGIFNSAAVSRLIDDHLSGRSDNRKQLWTLFMFHQWKDRYCP